MKHWMVLIGLIALLIIYMGCTSNSAPTVPSQGTVRFLSAEVCGTCHVQRGAQWEQTRHAEALESLEASANYEESCLPCHVTGFDGDPANSGYDDSNPLVAAKFGGAQCESCHGAAGDHIRTYDPLPSGIDSGICGECHNDAHHPTLNEWEGSGHAVSHLAWQNTSNYATECQACHAADYIFAESVSENAAPQDFDYGVTCVVCHDPHSSTNEYNLRTEAAELCLQCHTVENPSREIYQHRTSAAMFAGTGGYEYPGEIYYNSSHTTSEYKCVECHIWAGEFSELEVNTSGHSFAASLAACRECHPEVVDFNRKNRQTALQNLLDELKAELDAATENDKELVSYERALFNYNFVMADGSMGVHNYRYAATLLQDSIADFEPGS